MGSSTLSLFKMLSAIFEDFEVVEKIPCMPVKESDFALFKLKFFLHVYM